MLVNVRFFKVDKLRVENYGSLFVF
jgi:hypothetical protein